MEASADECEIRKFQIRRGDVLATKDSEEADDIAIPSLVAEDLPGVLCGYHLAMIRPRLASVNGSYLAWLHASKSFRAQYEAQGRWSNTIRAFPIRISGGVHSAPAIA